MADPNIETSRPSQTETRPNLTSPEIPPKINQIEITENAIEELKSTANSQERLDQIRQALEALSIKSQPSIHATSHPELDSQFFSVEDYFQKGNTHKTGYAILGYESIEPITFWKTIINSAKKYLPDRADRKKMIDVGCAYGYLLKHIAPEFDETIGLDISRTALEKARQSSPTSQLFETNLNQKSLPLAANSVDMATFLDSIEHVENPIAVLHEAVRIVREGGLIVISTPDIGNWLGKLVARANGDPSHISLFAQNDLLKIMESLGLEILEKHPFFPLGPIRIPVPANIEIVARKKAVTKTPAPDTA